LKGYCSLLKRHQKLLVFIFSMLLAGCASRQGPAYTYNEVVIVNQSLMPLSDVTISAAESGRVFSCGNIAPRGICANKFRPQPYRGNPIQVALMTGDGRRRNETIELTLPASFVAERPLRGVLVIGSRGEISAYLQQDAPGPHL
jgi:hypothetical protein